MMEACGLIEGFALMECRALIKANSEQPIANSK